MIDRRQVIRWQLKYEAKVKLEGREQYSDCRLLDINLKGMKLLCGSKLPKDNYIKFSLMLAPEFSFETEAWVVWQKSFEGKSLCGLYFHKIRDGDKERIYRFMFNNFPGQLQESWWQGPGEKQEGGREMAEAGFADRRVFERFAAKFPVRCLDGLSGRELKAESADLSAKGICLAAAENLAVSLPLELWLEVPDQGEPFYARGEVAWCQPGQAGCFRIGVHLERADLMGVSRVLRMAK